MTTRRAPHLFLAFVASLLIAACGSTASSAAPSPTPAGGPVTTPEQAVAAVVAHEPRLAGISERDPNAIGQASWYQVAAASGVGAFIVSVRVGWGDCPSGCIDEHTWVYAVGPNGEVTLQSEGGGEVPPDAWPSPAAAGGGNDGNGGADGPGTGLFVTAVSGPTCPVETNPPDPNCAPRPVTTAVIIVTDNAGNAVAKVQLDESASAFIPLPAGNYLVEAMPVDQLIGKALAQTVIVADGQRTPVEFLYDTGIRAPG